MGSKEFIVGIFLFKEGISLIKFPIVEEVKEVFLLYHMEKNSYGLWYICQWSTNRANMNFGDNENG